MIFRDETIMQLCKLCYRWFPGIECLKLHQKTHHESRHPVTNEIIFKCSYCSAVFHDKKALIEHVRFFHLEEECLISGVVCRGAFEMYQYISECHPPFFAQGKKIIYMLFYPWKLLLDGPASFWKIWKRHFFQDIQNSFW